MKESRFALAALACLALWSQPGCKKEPVPEAAPPPPRPAAPTAAPTQATTAVATSSGGAGGLPGGSEAQTVFKTKCVVCHGERGEGNGTGAAALTVKPRNYTDAKWQKSVTDAQIEEIILKGGGAVGKDPGMPANPDLKNKPEVIQDLRKIVRSFAKAEPDAGAAASPSAAVSASPAKAPPKTKK